MKDYNTVPHDWRRARDRVLLYATALNLPPYRGLELALASLKQSNTSSVAEAMTTFRELLHKEDLHIVIQNAKGELMNSCPPMKRDIMVAEPLDRAPWISRMKEGLSHLWKAFRRRK